MVGLETKVRAFGNYAVKIDSVAPSVTAVNISEGKNLSSAKNIQFKISDNLSGVETYDSFIDGNWVLGKYVPKRGTFTIPFDKYNNISKGKHLLKVLVKDERGNETMKEYQLYSLGVFCLYNLNRFKFKATNSRFLF